MMTTGSAGVTQLSTSVRNAASIPVASAAGTSEAAGVVQGRRASLHATTVRR
jgi:hypothetical protein